MIRIALDTNRYADLARNDTNVVRIAEQADALFLPFCVIAELRAGFLRGSKSRENETALRRFLTKPGVNALYPDEQTTRQYATLEWQLRRQGTPIPINDLWIAALVVQHQLTLFTRDQHFDHLPQVARV